MEKLQLSLLRSYLSFAKASVNSNMFKKLYFYKSGKETDILKNGNLSCAFFTSSVLKNFNLIKNTHATVSGTVKDLKENGWKEITKPSPGCIIVWEKEIPKKSENHKHIGIYSGGMNAISNSSSKRTPQITKYNFYKIEKILWNKKIK